MGHHKNRGKNKDNIVKGYKGGSVIKEHYKGYVVKNEYINKKRSKSFKELINIALVYPNTYQTAMSNLGFQSVYALFKNYPNISCERFFLPDRDLYKKNFNDHTNSIDFDNKYELKSYESACPISSFDIIAFSVSFENDYINIASILLNAKIPPRVSDRDKNFDTNRPYPFVIAGGVASFLNPEPIAPFIDCFLLGEAEEMLPAFLDTILNKSTLNSREPLKRELALNIKGAYIPQFYKPSYDINGNFLAITPIYDDIPAKISVQHISNLDNITTTTQILTNNTAFDNTFLIEIGRGCHHGCRFCSAGFIYRPPRFYPEESIIAAMNEAAEFFKTIGVKEPKIGLVGATVSDHPSINNICAKFNSGKSGSSDKIKISFSSLRLDALTDTTIETLVNSSVKTATIAPEAGSQRMRNIINKKIGEEQILSAVKRLVEHGIINLKLYFMVGLPFEEEDDIYQIVQLTLKIKDVFLEISKKNKKIGNITLSINPFIPKPNTPFQWCAMDSISNFKKKVAIIKDGLKRVPNISIHTESPKTAIINAILSKGDRRMADILEKERPAISLKENSSIFNPIAIDAPLPWDIVYTGIKKEFLLKEFKRAEIQKTSPDCPMVDCKRCGVCSPSRT
ncbi:MAG: radical SAM protein [Desulfamplus sp.]|nr:radical SAM protein [Desulfamplus sp.]